MSNIRGADISGDFSLGNPLLSGQDAIAENVRTRLSCWRGDCFFAALEGLDWASWLGSANPSKGDIAYSVEKVIRKSEGVIAVDNIDIQITDDRELGILTRIKTRYGSFEVSV